MLIRNCLSNELRGEETGGGDAELLAGQSTAKARTSRHARP